MGHMTTEKKIMIIGISHFNVPNSSPKSKNLSLAAYKTMGIDKNRPNAQPKNGFSLESVLKTYQSPKEIANMNKIGNNRSKATLKLNVDFSITNLSPLYLHPILVFL